MKLVVVEPKAELFPRDLKTGDPAIIYTFVVAVLCVV